MPWQAWSCVPANHAAKFGDLADWKSYKAPLKAYIAEFTNDFVYQVSLDCAVTVPSCLPASSPFPPRQQRGLCSLRAQRTKEKIGSLARPPEAEMVRPSTNSPLVMGLAENHRGLWCVVGRGRHALLWVLESL